MADLVGIDSNALTYLIQAIEPGYDPSTDQPNLRDQRLAMIRIFLYAARSLHLTPTVVAEYQSIQNLPKLESHSRTACLRLSDGPWALDSVKIATRVAVLEKHYRHKNDCLILAEAEALGFTHLLTNEVDFINRLNPNTGVTIQLPSEYWAYLGILPGSDPIWMPDSTNHLAGQQWWRI